MNEPLGPAAVAIIAVISVTGPASAAEWSARGQTGAGTRSLPPRAFAQTNRPTALGAAPSSPQTRDGRIREFLEWKERFANSRAAERSR
jgi:hypothetical protein